MISSVHAHARYKQERVILQQGFGGWGAVGKKEEGEMSDIQITVGAVRGLSHLVQLLQPRLRCQ